MSATIRPALLILLLALAACGPYRPGTDGRPRTLPQNASSNSEPQPAGSLPR